MKAKTNKILFFLSFTIITSNSFSAEEAGLFGDWGGKKTSLQESGYDFNVVYKADTVTSIRGASQNKFAFLGNVDVTLDTDLEKIFGLKGLSFFVYGLGNHGDQPSTYIGDSFVTSNIEAPNTFKAYEVYFKQQIDDRFSILFGLRDLNADYYSNDSGKPLINSAFGISPTLAQTGVNGPSIFPVAAPALAVSYNSPSSFYFQTALFNAQAGDPNEPKQTYIAASLENGLLSISEMGFSSESENGNTKYGLGAWSYSKQETLSINNGWYVIIDHGFTKDFSSFLKYGSASPGVNQFSTALELGINYKGLLSFRPEDSLVLGYAKANASDDYVRINTTTQNESVFEVAYNISAGSGISITPDYQLIKNPGLVLGSSSIEVLSLRFEINY
ncbi:MAG: carbohydrate porin [Pseudobdellovibrio sp.]